MKEGLVLNPITNEEIDSAMNYQEYLTLLDELFAAGKTTGNDHSEAMLNYAKMNIQRMKRLNKTIELSDELLKDIEDFDQKRKETIWFVITEGWCGDAAQNIPLLNKIAEKSDKIELKLVLRDENLELIDAFLTNGGRSIPKVIILDKANLNVKTTWGPRAVPAQKMSAEFRKIPNGDYQEFNKTLQLWYAKDKTISMQKEMSSIIKEL